MQLLDINNMTQKGIHLSIHEHFQSIYIHIEILLKNIHLQILFAEMTTYKEPAS